MDAQPRPERSQAVTLGAWRGQWTVRLSALCPLMCLRDTNCVEASQNSGAFAPRERTLLSAPANAGEGDHPKGGGGGVRAGASLSAQNRFHEAFAFLISRSYRAKLNGQRMMETKVPRRSRSPLHRPSGGPPPPLRGGG